MTLFHALGPFAAQAGIVAAPGMVLLTPTSITHSGTSASIGANGQVTFSAVTSLSLNGVFSADFDNYVVSIRGNMSSGSQAVLLRYRAAGTSATGTDYVYQQLAASSTSVDAFRNTSQTSNRLAPFSGTSRSAATAFIYGPYLAQPTAMRSVTITGDNDAAILDYANTHSLSTSYDGCELIPTSGNMTGALQVYGVRS